MGSDNESRLSVFGGSKFHRDRKKSRFLIYELFNNSNFNVGYSGGGVGPRTTHNPSKNRSFGGNDRELRLFNCGGSKPYGYRNKSRYFVWHFNDYFHIGY